MMATGAQGGSDHGDWPIGGKPDKRHGAILELRWREPVFVDQTSDIRHRATGSIPANVMQLQWLKKG